MGRPRKDKFEETSYRFEKGTEHERVYVSSPSFSKITYKVKISEYPDGKPVYATTEQVIRTLHHTDDEVKRLFREKDMIVTKIEKATISLPNFCERCDKEGVPIIQKKSNYDNRIRTNTDSPHRDNRHDEYWLYYQHTTKRCMIAQYDINHNLFKNPKRRTTKLQKHFFPFYLEKFEKESVA